MRLQVYFFSPTGLLHGNQKKPIEHPSKESKINKKTIHTTNFKKLQQVLTYSDVILFLSLDNRLAFALCMINFGLHADDLIGIWMKLCVPFSQASSTYIIINFLGILRLIRTKNQVWDLQWRTPCLSGKDFVSCYCCSVLFFLLVKLPWSPPESMPTNLSLPLLYCFASISITCSYCYLSVFFLLHLFVFFSVQTALSGFKLINLSPLLLTGSYSFCGSGLPPSSRCFLRRHAMSCSKWWRKAETPRDTPQSSKDISKSFAASRTQSTPNLPNPLGFPASRKWIPYPSPFTWALWDWMLVPFFPLLFLDIRLHFLLREGSCHSATWLASWRFCATDCKTTHRLGMAAIQSHQVRRTGGPKMGQQTRTSTQHFEYDHPVQQGTKKQKTQVTVQIDTELCRWAIG